LAHLSSEAGRPHFYPAFSGTDQALSRSAAGLPCFFESGSAGNRIRHTVASVFVRQPPDYAGQVADAEINGFWFYLFPS